MVESSPAENLGHLADERFSRTFQNASMPSCILILGFKVSLFFSLSFFAIERLNYWIN
jgi:hypothetical protein